MSKSRKRKAGSRSRRKRSRSRNKARAQRRSLSGERNGESLPTGGQAATPDLHGAFDAEEAHETDGELAGSSDLETDDMALEGEADEPLAQFDDPEIADPESAPEPCEANEAHLVAEDSAADEPRHEPDAPHGHVAVDAESAPEPCEADEAPRQVGETPFVACGVATEGAAPDRNEADAPLGHPDDRDVAKHAAALRDDDGEDDGSPVPTRGAEPDCESIESQGKSLPPSAPLVLDQPASGSPLLLMRVEDAADPLYQDPPFDPPDADELSGWRVGARVLSSAPMESSMDGKARSAPYVPEPTGASAKSNGFAERWGALEPPAPPIRIHAAWDRAESAEVVAGLADDARMARVTTTVERGGLDGAFVHLAAQSAPHLLIVDTDLNDAALLRGLDRLEHALDPATKVIMIGAANDIGLLRQVKARGVDEYLVAPVRQEELIRAICKLYAEIDYSRVIAVIGGRGGVGASTVAHNLAWSIAEVQGANAALVDLDLAFGATSFSCRQDDRSWSIADALLAPAPAVDAFLARIAVNQTSRLQVFPAPASVQREFRFDAQAVERVIKRVRRRSSFVVLDLPHAWNAWVREALLAADEAIIVASCDLASLRNTQNMLDVLKAERPDGRAPHVALSMVGVPERRDITLKDFVEALGVNPIVSLDYDPTLFDLAAMQGRMISQVAPLSPPAAAFDDLAFLLTAPPSLETENLFAAMSSRRPAARTSGIVEIALRTVQAALNGGPPRPISYSPERHDTALIAGLAAELECGDDYVARARRAALSEFHAMLHPPPRPPPQIHGPSPKIIVTAVAGALLAGGAWYVHQTKEEFPLLEGPPAAEASPPAPVSMDVPIDNATRYRFAMQLISVGRAREAATLLRRAADDADPMAQYRLAKLYENGEGVPLDLALARRWTERAALAGNRRAMHDLGVFLALGDAAKRDEVAAFRWFRQAAELGVLDSQYNLAILYLQGHGVAANASEALFWFQVAARQGDETAATRAAEIEASLSTMQAHQARVRARAFRARAADQLANRELGIRTLAAAPAASQLE